MLEQRLDIAQRCGARHAGTHHERGARSDAQSKRGASAAAAMGDIVATADGAGTFKTLLAAATAAGLVDTLKGPGPFTVFAPTDEAFAALPAGTLDGLLKDPEALKRSCSTTWSRAR